MNSVPAPSQIPTRLRLPAVTVREPSLLLGPTPPMCPVNCGASVKLCTVSCLLSPTYPHTHSLQTILPLNFQQELKHTQVLLSLLKHTYTERSLSLFFAEPSLVSFASSIFSFPIHFLPFRKDRKAF